MSEVVYNGESNASRVVRTLLENETMPPKPKVSCAWCHRVYDPNTNTYTPLGNGPGVSHGICPACYQQMTGQLPKSEQSPISAA